MIEVLALEDALLADLERLAELDESAGAGQILDGDSERAGQRVEDAVDDDPAPRAARGAVFPDCLGPIVGRNGGSVDLESDGGSLLHGPCHSEMRLTSR